MLNLIIYEVELPYGQVKEYVANVNTVNVTNKLDSDGFITILMEVIVDHQKYKAT